MCVMLAASRNCPSEQYPFDITNTLSKNPYNITNALLKSTTRLLLIVSYIRLAITVVPS